MSRTYAIAEVSPAVYAEVRALLVAAGYEHAIHREDDGEVLDMHGIALRAIEPAPEAKSAAVALENARAAYHKWKRVADNHAQDIVESVDGAQDNQAFRDLAGLLVDLKQALEVTA